tara:strand:- start:1806 stop:2219 length:414 start_codon:yes stop_codon:yes gene_type:complete
MLSLPTLLAWCERHNLQIGDIMSKTNKVLAEELAVMTNKVNSLQEQLDAHEDTRPFDIIVERVDETNKYLLVIPSKNFSAQLIRRDKNTLISTSDFVHSEEETKSNEAVQEIIERKYRFDNLATQKDVVQGDAPSAS